MHRTTGRFLLIVAISLFPLSGCGDKGGTLPDAKIEVEENVGQVENSPGRMEPIELTADEAGAVSPAKVAAPEVIVHTSQGDIRIKLFSEEAPQTVSNFLENYVDRGLYRDTLVHYVEKDYMMIAGGYTSGFEKIPARAPVVYEGHNGLRNQRGTIAVNRHPDYIHSGTSEFFFNLADNQFLDDGDTTTLTESGDSSPVPGYCVFGEIVEGIEVMEKIGAVSVTDREGFPQSPTDPVTVISVERVR